MKPLVRLFWMMIAVGCGSPAIIEPSGNAALGIARFQIDEAPARVTVRGLGSDGQEIGRVALFRGRFRLSGAFAEGYDNPDVDGRKIDVSILGQHLAWETEGYEPTLRLPAHPRSQWAIQAFLDDAHVRPLLDRWQIGFSGRSTVGRAITFGRPQTGFVCDVTGTQPKDLTGATSSTTLVGISFNLCGAGSAANDAWIVHQDAAHWGYDQSLVTECCPEVPGPACTGDADCPTGPVPWHCVNSICTRIPFYAQKSCPDAGAGMPSSCGTVVGGCKACPEYATNGRCALSENDAGWFDDAAPLGGAEAVNICSDFDWHCGDGFCDPDENCSSCAADCGCTGVDTCGGGGTPGACGCTPLAACPAGFQCGTIPDGCGGTIDCSGGRSCDEIVGGSDHVCNTSTHTCYCPLKFGRCD